MLQTYRLEPGCCESATKADICTIKDTHMWSSAHPQTLSATDRSMHAHCRISDMSLRDRVSRSVGESGSTIRLPCVESACFH